MAKTLSFQAHIAQFHARMAMLRETVERDGHLIGESARDPSYRILLSRSVSGDAPWRVTSFRNGEPTGHREYDVLDGKGPTQNALQEFAGADVRLITKTTGA